MNRANFDVTVFNAAMLTAHAGLARPADTSTRYEPMAGEAPIAAVIGWAAGRCDLSYADAANEDRGVADDH